MIDDFEKFCSSAKNIINDTFKEDALSFSNNLRRLFSIYHMENHDFIMIDELSLILAVFLFKGNPMAELLVSQFEISSAYPVDFISCALHSKNENFFRLAVDLTRESSLEKIIECVSKIITSKNFERFKYFVEHTELQSEITYPRIFYNLVGESSPEIFKYIIETKPYTTEDIYGLFRMGAIKLNHEIVKMMLELPQTDTFKLEFQLQYNLTYLRENTLPRLNVNSKNINHENMLPLCIRDIANVEENLRIVKKHNDQYRMFEDKVLNSQLRLKLLEVDQQILILNETLFNLETLVNSRDVFASSTGIVLTQKTSSELDLLTRDREKIYQEFYQANK